MKRFFPLIGLAFLVLSAPACKTVTRSFIDPTPTAVVIPIRLPTQTPPPTPTPLPSPTPDTCPNGDCIPSCLEKLSEITTSKGVGGDSKSTRRYFVADDEYTLVTYDILDDQIENPVDESGLPKNFRDYQDDRLAQEQIWNYFAAIIPSENRKFLTEYVIFTDGKENILAMVSQSDHSPTEWTLSVDIMDATNPQDLTFTLVHEYGHLLTLNPTQVIPSERIFNNPESETIYQQEFEACQAYFPGEGCANPDSYLQQFVERFWNAIYAEWAEIDSLEDEDEYYKAIDTFYEKYTDQFVTDYAPTSPAEDIAETFSYFILQPKPTGTTLADQKILFFYEFPELVQLRSQMGRRLCAQLEK